MSKAKRNKRRDITSEAAAEVDELVAAYRGRTARELYDIAMKRPKIREFIDDSVDAARQTVFNRLLRFSKTTHGNGFARTNVCFRRFVQDENGRQRQEMFWAPTKATTRDEFMDARTHLRANVIGAINSFNTTTDYWNETHPDEPPFGYYGDDGDEFAAV